MEGPLLVAPLRLRGKVLGVARVFPSRAFGAPPRVAEVLSASLSAAIRNVLLYRSLLDSIDDVAQARAGSTVRSSAGQRNNPPNSRTDERAD